MDIKSLTQRNTLLKQTSYIQQRKWTFQPQGQLPISNLSSTIRINIQGAKQGFMCPYSSYIRVVVKVPSTTTVGSLTLDHPDALIETFRVTTRGKQIQRTIQCNRLMDILHTMGTIQARRNFVNSSGWESKPYFKSATQSQGMANLRANLAQTGQPAGTYQVQVSGGSTGYLPTQTTIPLYNGSNGWNPQQGVIMQQKATISHINPMNPVFPASTFMAASQVSWLQAYMSVFNCAKNIRAQYIYANQNCDRIQTTNSKNSQMMTVSQDSVNYQSYPAKVGNSYQLAYPGMIDYMVVDPQQAYTTQPMTVSVPNSIAGTGYSNFCSPLYWKSDPNLVLSNTVPSVSFSNGQFLSQRQPQSYAQIKCAIPSNQFGILIPQNQFRRVPLAILNQCSIQLTFCPSAFYSSGYCDGTQYDQLGMGTQVDRNYIVTQVQLVVQWFVYKNNLSYQTKLLNTPIYFQTYHYQLLLVQVLPNAMALGGVFLVSAPSGNLAQLIIRITSNDYNQYNFARRNYALSANITSLQVRHNGIYYPDAPYVGNGGNPVMTSEQALTNSTFMENLGQSHLYRKQFAQINPYNFAVNSRVYDVTNTATLYNQAQSFQVAQGVTTQFTQPVNLDTAMGQPYLHQKRCCGRAIYVIPFNSEVMQGDVRVVSGLNTMMNNNVEVLIQTDKSSNYPRPVVLQIWGVYSKNVVPNVQGQKKGFLMMD